MADTDESLASKLNLNLIPNTTKPKSPRNLLLWSPYGSGEHYCGPAIYTHRVYSQIDKSSFRCSLAHGFSDQEQNEVFDQQSYVGDFGRNWFRKFQFIKTSQDWLKQNSGQFDLIHAIGDSDSSLAAAKQSMALGKPAVLFVSIENGRLIPRKDLKNKLGMYKRRQQVANRLDAVIALSSEIDLQLQSVGIAKRKIARIPNFADTDRFRPVDEQERRELREQLNLRDIPTIAFAGRLCDRKQPHLIVEAIKLLRDQNIETQCVLAGPSEPTDPYMVKLNSYVKENRLTNQVHRIGFTSSVESWLQAADVFCLPSLSEGMPGALIEALACGLPVIATAFSSATDVVTDERLGRVLPLDSSASSIADTVKEFLPSNVHRDDCLFRQHFIEDHFSLQAVAKLHQDLFDRVCRGVDARV